MRKLILTISGLFIFVNGFSGVLIFQTHGDHKELEWTDAAAWDLGKIPPLSAGNNADDFHITINNTDIITRTGKLGEYKNKLTLIIKTGGYLKIIGDFDVQNHLNLVVEDGAVFIVTGIIDLHNNGSINLEGEMQVNGIVGQNSNTNKLTGNGTLYMPPGNIWIEGVDYSPGVFDGIIIRDGWLPVELLSFTARPSSLGIELHWVTATETNNQGYEIQRLDAASRQWEIIGWVEGNYNHNGILKYYFTDNLSGAATQYYRLRQLDFDGKYKFYGPVATAFGGGEKNGVFGVFRYDASWHISLPGYDPCRVDVFDLTGRKIFSDQGTGSLSLPVHHQPVIIRVTDQWMQSSSRIIM